MYNSDQEVGAIIVAAGHSQRMGNVDKIFALLAGETVILRVLMPFLECKSIDRVVVLLNGKNYDEGTELFGAQNWDKEVVAHLGGRRRQDSVLAGLKQLGECDFVVIHDGARPLVTVDLIERGIEAAQETGAASAAIPATDTVKVADLDMYVRETLSRENLWQIQTPQVFSYDMLTKAYGKVTTDVTDDAQIVELNGGKVKLYQGAYDNIKITTPADLAIAEILWKRRKRK